MQSGTDSHVNKKGFRQLTEAFFVIRLFKSPRLTGHLYIYLLEHSFNGCGLNYFIFVSSVFKPLFNIIV